VGRRSFSEGGKRGIQYSRDLSISAAAAAHWIARSSRAMTINE